MRLTVLSASAPGDRAVAVARLVLAGALRGRPPHVRAANDRQYTQTAILNLATGAVSNATVSNTAHDMFCPGASILPDGEVIVTGGIGTTDTSI